jgi:hypothetical protein
MSPTSKAVLLSTVASDAAITPAAAAALLLLQPRDCSHALQRQLARPAVIIQLQ